MWFCKWILIALHIQEIFLNLREEDNCTEWHFSKVTGWRQSRSPQAAENKVWECDFCSIGGNLNFCFSWTPERVCRDILARSSAGGQQEPAGRRHVAQSDSCLASPIEQHPQMLFGENSWKSKLPAVARTCSRVAQLSMNVQMQKVQKIYTFVMITYEKTLTFTYSLCQWSGSFLSVLIRN